MRRRAGTVLAVFLLLSEAGAADPAERSIEDAARSIRKGAFEPARRSLEAALDRLARHRDPPAEARAHRSLGFLLDATGDPDGAERAFRRAAALARDLHDRAGEAGVLRDRGFGHWRRAEYPEAERLALEALAIQNESGDRAGRGASLDLLGRIALKRGRTDEAIGLLAQAVELRGTAGDGHGEVESRLALIQTRMERREYDAAIGDARSLEARGSELGDRDVVVEATAQSAIAWLIQNAPDAALECLDRARALASAPPDPALLARLKHLEANARRLRRDHEGAIRAHDEAIAAYAELGDRREEAWNLARRGRSQAAIGRTAEAEASLARALAIWAELKDGRAAAYFVYERGRLLDRLGRHDEAWRSWEEAIRVAEEIDLPYQALVLGEMAWLAARRGDPVSARSLAERAVGSAERSEIPEMLWNALYRKALVERRDGRRSEALASLRRCLSVVEATRKHVVPADEALVGFLEDKQEIFAEAVDLLMEMGRFDEALEVGERARARAFLDLRRDHSPGSGEPIPALATLREAWRLHGAVIVEYFVGRARTSVWVVAPGAPVRAVTLAIGAEAWARRIGQLRSALLRGPSSGSADLVAVLRELERDLWRPVARWLPRRRDGRVTIVPHGPLLMLPFAGLVSPDGKYLVENLALDYAPSIAALGALEASSSRRRGGAHGCLAIGNPGPGPSVPGTPRLSALPDAEAEAAAAAEALGEDRRDVLVGPQATESRVRALAPDRAWIHFATHGVIRDDDPLESALLLAPSEVGGESGDGRLTAREVLGLPLRATLVTLSACDSGLGRVTGEGMLGLCRSFLHAGAGSVVVSLWRVSDLVGRFQMSRFYESLADGIAPTRALRRAQLDTLAALRRGEIRTPGGQPLNESPLFWAPYVLVGSGERPRALAPG